MSALVIWIVVGASLLLVLLIIWAPWKQVRAEHPLPTAVESRILLGEDPQQIAHDLDEADAEEAESDEEWNTAELAALRHIDESDPANPDN